jgi:hypothetical protein
MWNSNGRSVMNTNIFTDVTELTLTLKVPPRWISGSRTKCGFTSHMKDHFSISIC